LFMLASINVTLTALEGVWIIVSVTLIETA
jgi:hypothetical protein